MRSTLRLALIPLLAAICLSSSGSRATGKACFILTISPEYETEIEQTIERRMLLQLRGLDLVCPDYNVSVRNGRAAMDSSAILQYFARAFSANVDEVEMIYVNAHVWDWDTQSHRFDALVVAWDQVFQVTASGRHFQRMGGAHVVHWGRDLTVADPESFASQAVNGLLNLYRVE